jgi:hypothetical protein
MGCKTGSIDLRFHPKHQSRYKILFATDGKVSMSFAGQNLDTDVHNQIASTMDVDSLPGKKYGIKLTYTDYNIREKINGQEFDLSKLSRDSTGNETDALEFLKGLSFTTVMNETGKTEAIDGSDSMLGRIESSMKEMPSPVQKQVLTTLRPLVNNDMAKGILEQCFYIFPDEKVDIGDEWRNEIVMQSMFSMVITSTYTLMEVQNGIAKLKVHSIIKPGKPDVTMPGLAMAAPRNSTPIKTQPGIDLMGMNMKAEFDGTQDGNVWVNFETGMVLKTALNQDLTGKISISILSLPMTMKMSSSYTVEPL